MRILACVPSLIAFIVVIMVVLGVLAVANNMSCVPTLPF